MMLPIPRGGVLRRVIGRDEALAVPLIEGLEITIPVGQPVVPLPEGDRYLGFLFARGETPAAVEAALREAHSKLDVPDRGAGRRPTTTAVLIACRARPARPASCRRRRCSRRALQRQPLAEAWNGLGAHRPWPAGSTGSRRRRGRSCRRPSIDLRELLLNQRFDALLQRDAGHAAALAAAAHPHEDAIVLDVEQLDVPAVTGDTRIDLSVDQLLDVGRERIVPDRVRVVDLEPAADKLADEVDRGAAQLVEAATVDQDLEVAFVLHDLAGSGVASSSSDIW